MKNTLKTLVFKPEWQNEGDGARVIRIIGNSRLPDVNPFLMLDYARVRLPGGFPDHPHRGFETVSYMLKGSFYHQDSKGHKGVIGPGDLQWMTAGRGIMHSEMPGSKDQDSIGFQLWINLQSKYKMIEPCYQEFKADKIPTVEKQGAKVKVMSGEWQNVKGPIVARTPVYYFDVELRQNGHFSLDIPKTWNSVVFVFEGEVIYNDATRIPHEHIGVLDKQIGTHNFVGKRGRFLLIAGEPIKEPIAKYGPIVMNTQAQVQQAFHDYQFGQNGFEGAQQWQSKIRQLAHGRRPKDVGF